MRLEITGKNVGVPTLELITRVVNDESYRDEFFIIIKDDESFLQATGTNLQLHVEYRDSSEAKHLYCSSAISCEELITLCMRYIKEDKNWSDTHKWSPLDDF